MFNRNRITIIGGSGRLAWLAVAALTHLYSRDEIVCLTDGRTGLVSEVYDLRLRELRDVRGSLKPQQITHGPQRRGTRGKIRRW